MIKYVAFYNLEEFKNERRTTNLAGVNVVDYMKDVFASYDSVKIISPARSNALKGRYKSKKKQIEKNIELQMPFSWGTRSKIGKIFLNIFTESWLFFKLVFRTKKKDNVVVYHSPYVMKVVSMAKKLKKFNLTLEIREIYADAMADGAKFKQKELKYFAKADKYIFATEELNKIINANQKKYIVAPGVFRYNDFEVEKFNDDKIHIVYAGTLDKIKGGVYTALNIAEKLSSRYIVHILGEGTDVEKEEIRNLINSNEKYKGKVIYEGTKMGAEFSVFLKKCDIGLSTQKLVGTFNESSFPSKVLTYLSNGLTVVSSKIDAIKNSAVGDLVVYYEKEDYEYIANIIDDVEIKNKTFYKNRLNVLNDLLISDFSLFMK